MERWNVKTFTCALIQYTRHVVAASENLSARLKGENMKTKNIVFTLT